MHRMSAMRSKERSRECANGVETESLSDKLLNLVEEAGVYYTVINGNKQLSIGTGTILMDLVAHCGVSREKLPLVVTLVLHMLWGKESSSAVYSVVKSVATNDLCTRRAAHATKLETSRSFGTDQGAP